MARRAKAAFSSSMNVEILELEGAGHGFLNPACPTYNDKFFTFCCSKVQESLAMLSQNQLTLSQQFSGGKNNLQSHLHHNHQE